MPKATGNIACGNNHLSQADEMVPSSQEELSRSEQEPDPQSHFINLDHPNQSQACSCHTLKALKWTGQLMMECIIGF